VRFHGRRRPGGARAAVSHNCPLQPAQGAHMALQVLSPLLASPQQAAFKAHRVFLDKPLIFTQQC
jgi:hypothetical protein